MKFTLYKHYRIINIQITFQLNLSIMLKTKNGSIIPLKSVNCYVDIKENVAAMIYDQHFVNEDNNPIEAIYVFPVPTEASVFSFEAKLDDGNVIVGICKEKEEAKKEYNQAINTGNTAYYMDRDDGNSFRICIGNLAPLTGVQIKIKLVCELDNEDDYRKIRLNIPTSMGTKYTPSYYYNSSAFTSSVTNPSKVDRKPYMMNIIGDIIMGSKLVSIDSKTHKIKLSNMETHSAHFEIQHLEELNCDVVLIIERELSITSAFTQELTTLKNSVLRYCTAINIVPDFSKLPKVNVNNCNYVLCLDVSGSMRGKSIEVCKEASQQFVTCIPNGASFQLFTFNSSFEEFKSDKKDIMEKKQDASKWIDKIYASGGTELLPVLKNIYSNVDKNKNTVLIILSDGEISNTSDVFRLVKSNPNVSVFSVGIGNNVSQNLIKGLAKHGNGYAAFIGEGDKDTGKIVRSQLQKAQDTLHKHQNNYKIDVDVMGGHSQNVPSTFAPIYEHVDNIMYVFSEFEPSVIRYTTYEETTDNDTNNNIEHRIEHVQTIVPIKLENYEFTLHRIAGIKRINELSAQEKSETEKSEADKPKVNITTDNNIKQEIISISTDLNVLSNYTAFIGVENKVNKVKGDMILHEVPLQIAKGEKYYDSVDSLRSINCPVISYGNVSVPKQLSRACYSARSVISGSPSPTIKNDWFETSETIDIKNRHLININKPIGVNTVGSTHKNVTYDISSDNYDNYNDIPDATMRNNHEISTYTSSIVLNIRQPPVGRSAHGGLRYGELERDAFNNVFKNESLKQLSVFIIDKPLHGLNLSGTLTSKQNESLLNRIFMIYGLNMNVPSLRVADIITISGEQETLVNGFYKIINLGSNDEPWVLQLVQ